MTISLRALIALEKSANRALRAAIDPVASLVTDQVREAAAAQDVERALGLLDALDFAPHVDRVLPVIEELALSTAIFGASQRVPAHQTMFTKGLKTDTVFAAARQMTKMAAAIANKGVKARGQQMLLAKSDGERREILRKSFDSFCCPRHTLTLKAELVKAPDGKTVRVSAEQDDISDALNAATLGNARMAADVASNLTTTRLAAYGFLSQAEDTGVSTYQVTAELDDRTCPVCLFMHGKTFNVGSALKQTESALNAEPSDLEDIAPWPGQTRGDLEDLLQMDPQELQDAGYMVPPFHPGCRCVLVDAGKVDETIRPQTASEAKETASSPGWFDSLLNMLLGKGSNADGPPGDPIEDL